MLPEVRYTNEVKSATSYRDRGATIGTVLLLTVIVVMFALALTGSSVTHLQFAQKTANGEVAKSMAESVIAAGLERILQDEEFGVSRSESEFIELLGADTETNGRLVFGEETASAWGVERSTNNLSSEGAVAGASGRVVPGRSVHLVGLGESNGVKRRVEAIFYIPKFPYVVASSGKLETHGETLIASVDRAEDLQSIAPPDLDSLLPGDALANSTASDALHLSEDTIITGDAKSAGGVEAETGARVVGQILSNSGTENIPRYTVSDFDPEANGKLGVNHLLNATVTKPRYEGWVRREGDLFVGQGLHLDNGILYVDGDLTISGGVTGVGALLVTGNTTITGRSSLSTDNLAAIVSEGDVILQGPQRHSSSFRGLVYSNQGLLAENMTIVGTLLLGGDGHDLILRDSTVVYSPDSVRVDLQHKARTALSFVSPKGSNPGAFLGTKKSDKSGENRTIMYVVGQEDGAFLVYPRGSDEKNAVRAESVDEAIALIRSLVAAGGENERMQAFDSTIKKKLPELLSGLQSGAILHEEESVDLASFDPAQFLSLADRIRLLLIHDV